jgi:palmitoyltransferase
LGNGMRFRITRTRLIDALMDCCTGVMDCFVLVIGPLLIMLALSITSLLTFSFFTVLLPMMIDKHGGSPLGHVKISLHICWVVFVVTNVLYNYFYAVTTRNNGKEYDRVVRELAQATEFCYPETPAQVEGYKREFEDRMVLRMRRRQARSEQQQQQSTTGVTQRRGATPAPTPRSWMLMGPYEWGYCSFSNQPKPPRSHYDHVTKKLVLNLDHYW